MAQISTSESDHYYEDLTPETFEELLNALRKGEPVKQGPQRVERHTSDPVGGATTLKDPALYDGSKAQPIAELPNSKPAPAPAG